MKRSTVIGLAIVALVAVGLPVFLHERKAAQRNACLNNLRQLTAPMECCVPLAYRLKAGDRLDPKLVCQYIKGNTMPVCPAGGTYIVDWTVGGKLPKCSCHGDLQGTSGGDANLEVPGALDPASTSPTDAQRSRAVPTPTTVTTAREEGPAPGQRAASVAIGQMKTRDKLITIRTGPDGPLYTVKSEDGKVLAADLPAADISAKFPDLKGVVEGGVADWAGMD